MSGAVELWLPAWDRFDPGHPLHRLLARADRLDPGPRGYLAGLAAWFDTARPIPAGALTRELAAHDAGGAGWLCADPAWIEPDMTGARLLACGRMQLGVGDAEALAEPLRPLLEEQGMHLELTTPDRWHLRLPAGTVLPDFPAPERALGEDLLSHLPQGPQGRRWRILQNELQVLLHQHPLNARRRAAGYPPVNSLWLWGGGTLPTRVGTRLSGVVSGDPLLRALAARAGIVHRPRDAADDAFAAGPGWLVDLQDLPAASIATEWWPAIDALARRQPLHLNFASGERRLHRPWHRWRFWRSGT
ncbi:phosphoglycerate mutase [Fulvimonas yonginensis]|uniref:Phosphoglycerate mutase n=1 Tax=Fulvimonas yonginensis TaxID=1495200 RepID=A0ABU8JDN2_9GAMM